MPHHNDFREIEIRKVRSKIQEKIYTKVGTLDTVIYKTKEPLPYSQRLEGEKCTVTVGDKWGENWDCAWFHFTGQVPDTAKGQAVVLLLDVNGELCVFDHTGCPIEGLTSVEQYYPDWLGSPGKHVFSISSNCHGNEKIDLWADCASNDLFGGFIGEGKLKEAYIATCNVPLRDLSYDLEVLFELYDLLPKNRARKYSIFYAMYEAVIKLSNYTAEEALAAREILKPILQKTGGDPSLRFVAIGHAHLDLAWAWPIRETIRKGARTFSTVVANMERYPDYIFGASQPQLYVWMKQYYPALFEKVKILVSADRWEPQGAMWVESDTNLPNGESLIRQVLYGKRYFQEEFGQEMKVAWLPDIFGYSGALPQILKKSGVDYFMSVKLHGNKYNKLPHHTFIWKGIDGTGILTHLPPEAYNSSAAPHAFFKLEEEYAEKGITDECLLLFGIGDGGGGPGEAHLERLAREKNLEGMSPVRQGKSIELFHSLEKNMDKLETWKGELYFECHQGTYTSQALCKKNNRMMEHALHELELWEAISGRGMAKEQLDEIWREMLLYQFHDILPGSSITRVYNEANARYSVMLEELDTFVLEAKNKLSAQIDTSSFQQPYIVLNTLSWDRTDWVKVKDGWKQVLVPALGYTVIDGNEITDIPDGLSATADSISNGILTVTFDESGCVCSVFDILRGQEILSNNKKGNRLALYNDDQQLGSDAWDFPITVRDRQIEYPILISSETHVDGAHAICTQKYTINNSTIQQEIVLTAGSNRLDFRTHVHWNERSKMLRTSFPVDVMTNNVTCDIQFGNVARPTHSNTSWDAAKYEIYAHKWIDISQTDKGVALLNDCKYGYCVVDNVLDMNLIRSTEGPDDKADEGEHDFTYSLYPHAGNHIQGEVNRAGYELNMPLTTLPLDIHKGSLPNCWSLASTDCSNVIIETVKQSEDDSALIFRLYESDGASAKVHLQLGFEAEHACLVDLLERDLAENSLDNKNIILSMRPFEICTIKILPKNKVF